MNLPTFCVNERALLAIGLTDDGVDQRLLRFVTLLEETVSTTEAPLTISESVFVLEVGVHQEQFASVLYAEHTGVRRDVMRRLAIVLGRCKSMDLGSQSAVVTVQMKSGRVNVASEALEYVVNAVADRPQYFGVLSVGEDGLTQGPALLSTPDRQEREAYLVLATDDIPLVYRRTLANLESDESDFFSIARLAFPRLLFAPSVSFRRLSGGYGSNLQIVCDHLSFLNDEFLDLAAESRWDYGSMLARARIRFSDESPATKANAKAMREREVEIRGVRISCTLHTKLSATDGRIHFHPPVEQIDQRVIVGIFVDHLST